MRLYHEDLVTSFRKIGFSDFQTLIPAPTKVPAKLGLQWSRYVDFPALIKRSIGESDSLHVIDHSYGHLCAATKNSTVTCHDIAEYRLNSLRGYQRALWKRRVQGMRKASKIMAISENTKKDVVELLGIPSEKVIVNYYGHDQRFSSSNDDHSMVFEKFNLEAEKQRNSFFILHVGSNFLRKNILTLLKAVKLLKDQDVDITLIKVGVPLKTSEFSQRILSDGIGDCIRDLGLLSLDELVGIYRAVDVLSFPSTYEGFGRPILEAHGCGCPTVLASSSCLREVGGEAALYHEPLDFEQLAEHLNTLRNNQNLMTELRNKGLKNVSRFSWEKHAEVLLEHCS